MKDLSRLDEKVTKLVEIASELQSYGELLKICSSSSSDIKPSIFYGVGASISRSSRAVCEIAESIADLRDESSK